jgi:hypothetical protein
MQKVNGITACLDAYGLNFVIFDRKFLLRKLVQSLIGLKQIHFQDEVTICVIQITSTANRCFMM